MERWPLIRWRSCYCWGWELQRLLQKGIDTAPIDLVKPWQNGANESVNGKFRDGCLGMHWFKNRIDAKVAIDDRRKMYDDVRPHSSLNNFTPLEYVERISTMNPDLAVFWESLVRRSQAGHFDPFEENAHLRGSLESALQDKHRRCASSPRGDRQGVAARSLKRMKDEE